MQQNDAFSEHPPRHIFFGSTSEAYSAFHNKPLTSLWPLVPLSLSTKFPYGPTIRTAQLAGSGDDSVHVSSISTATLGSENVQE